MPWCGVRLVCTVTIYTRGKFVCTGSLCQWKCKDYGEQEMSKRRQLLFRSDFHSDRPSSLLLTILSPITTRTRHCSPLQHYMQTHFDGDQRYLHGNSRISIVTTAVSTVTSFISITTISMATRVISIATSVFIIATPERANKKPLH